MTISCKCSMFITHGICWHTGYDPHKGTQVQKASLQIKNANGVPHRTLASKAMPEAYQRRVDFLERCEELNPGSSGIDGN